MKPLISRHLDAWEAGRYVELIKDVKDAAQEDGWGTPHDQEFELASAGQKEDSMVESNRMRAAVCMVINRDPGGLYRL